MDLLLLGIDGGASGCRARLCTMSGASLGEGAGGPANIRLGAKESLASVLQATRQCMSEAGLSPRELERVVACLALAGASEPSHLEAIRRHRHPYRTAVFVPDAQAACIGAHGGRDGGTIVIGTGMIGWAELNGRQYRVGGWGWPISDEGSGAWLGCEALRRTLWAHDGRIPWTPLLRSLFVRFRSDPHAIVRWMTGALPRDFATFAPEVVGHASADDQVAVELLRLAGGHVDALAQQLVAFGVGRVSLGGDAVDGALQLARNAAQSELRGELTQWGRRR